MLGTIGSFVQDKNQYEKVTIVTHRDTYINTSFLISWKKVSILDLLMHKCFKTVKDMSFEKCRKSIEFIQILPNGKNLVKMQ